MTWNYKKIDEKIRSAVTDGGRRVNVRKTQFIIYLYTSPYRRIVDATWRFLRVLLLIFLFLSATASIELETRTVQCSNFQQKLTRCYCEKN